MIIIVVTKMLSVSRLLFLSQNSIPHNYLNFYIEIQINHLLVISKQRKFHKLLMTVYLITLIIITVILMKVIFKNFKNYAAFEKLVPLFHCKTSSSAHVHGI